MIGATFGVVLPENDPPSKSALRAELDPVIKHVDLAEIETPHRKARRRAGRVERQHANRALYGFRGGAIALVPHCLLIDDLDRCGGLAHCEAKPARAFGDRSGVERAWRGCAAASRSGGCSRPGSKQSLRPRASTGGRAAVCAAPQR